MVERAPALLSCDVRRDLHRKVVILQTLGLRRVARWLRKNPGLVDVDVEGEIRPTVELLRSVRVSPPEHPTPEHHRALAVHTRAPHARVCPSLDHVLRPLPLPDEDGGDAGD